MSSVSVPVVSNVRVIGGVQRISKRAVVLFAANLASPGSLGTNCTTKTGGCVGGPFVPRRLSTRVRDLVRLGTKGHDRGTDYRVGLKECALSTGRTALGSARRNDRGVLATQRTGVLRLLTMGGGRIIHHRTMLDHF